MAAQTVNNNQSRVWRLRGEQGPVRLHVAPMLRTGQFLTHGLEGLNDVAESRGLAAWGEVTCPLVTQERGGTALGAAAAGSCRDGDQGGCSLSSLTSTSLYQERQNPAGQLFAP